MGTDAHQVRDSFESSPQRIVARAGRVSGIQPRLGRSGGDKKDLYRITEWKADLRVGGKWSSDGMGADGKSFRVEGEYLEIDPPRLLVHTWLPSWAHPVKTVVRWELEPQSVHGLHPNGPRKAGTGTLVRVRQEGFAGNIAVAT